MQQQQPLQPTQLMEPLCELRGHADVVLSACLSPNGSLAITGSEDSSARVWDVVTGAALHVLRHSSGVTGVALFVDVGSKDEGIVVTATNQAGAQTWDLASGSPLRTIGAHVRASSVALSGDGSLLVTGSFYDPPRIWTLETGTLVRKMEGHFLHDQVAVSADGSLVVANAGERHAQTWDAASGKPHKTFARHTKSVSCVALSTDASLLVTSSVDGTARVWDVGSGSTLAVLTGHSRALYSAAFSPEPNPSLVATASMDKTVRLWRWRTLDTISVIRHPSWVRAVCFASLSSPTAAGLAGKSKSMLLTACNDGVARAFRSTWSAERATLALLGRPAHARGKAVRRFILDVDGDHAVWSRVVGFLAWA